jgi:hypothetical protein
MCCSYASLVEYDDVEESHKGGSCNVRPGSCVSSTHDCSALFLVGRKSIGLACFISDANLHCLRVQLNNRTPH